MTRLLLIPPDTRPPTLDLPVGLARMTGAEVEVPPAGALPDFFTPGDTGALRGSFGQLRKLKKAYPNIKVLFSFGGWTWSGGFGQAAANPDAFAESCYKLVKDPRWADVFDGIDIDWEYPNACGLNCDTSGPDAYVKLMSALRSRFGASALVTAAVPAGSATINAANYAAASQYVNWYNVMSYDFFGAFGDLFSGLDYFTGGDFEEALAGGFMK